MLFRNQFLQAVIAVLGYFKLTDGSTCVYDTCECEYRIATCRDLFSIPPLADNSGQFNVTHLMFYAGNITEVGDNSLPPNLTVVHFNGNPIINISRHAFQASSKTLDNLFFSGVAFTKLPDAMLDLQHLTGFAVFDTHIKDWNIPVQQHLNKTLEAVNIEALTEWPSWVSDFASLHSIYISDSNLNPIPDDAFRNFIETLYVLNLINVSLSSVPKAISQLNLTSLSLSGNRLTDVTGLPKTNHIDLSFNAISDSDKLVSALLPIGAKITTLYLESNNLTEIPGLENVDIERLIITNNQISDHTKGTLPQALIDLDLSGNRLTSVPTMVTNLPNINTLDLSFNFISNISITLVHQNLEELILGNNKISQLLSSDFPANSSLRYLYLNGNPLVNIPPDAFTNLQNLTDLNLDDTELTSVPLFLTPLVNLKTLSMGNIAALNCSCPRHDSLVKWFSSGKLFSVTGNCSNGVTLEDFYSDQSQACGVDSLLFSFKCMSLCFVVLLLLYVFRI